MRAQTQERQFFFINKSGTSTSLSNSARKETFQILSHVRRGQSGSPVWAGQMLNFDEDGGENMLLISRSEQNCNKKQQRHMKCRKVARSHVEEDRFLTYPKHNSTDPFHSTILGEEATPLLHLAHGHAGWHLSRITYLAEALAPPVTISKSLNSRHDRVISYRLKACVDNELLMCSTLAHAACSSAWVRGHIGHEISRRLITRTLGIVQARLADPNHVIDEALIISVYTLMLSSTWDAVPHMWQPVWHGVRLEAFEESRTHIKGLLVFGKQVGGCHALSRYVCEGMVLADKYAALHSLSKPVIPMTWAPPPEPPVHLSLPHGTQQTSIARLSGLRRLKINTELLKILQELLDFNSIAIEVWQKIAQPDADLQSWLFLRLHSFYYRLLTFEPQTMNESCLKLMTLAIQISFVSYAAGKLSAHATLGHLREVLEQSELDSDRIVDQELLLWCMLSAAMVKGTSTAKTWFLDRLRPTAADLLLPLWDSARLSEQLEAFFYVPERQDRDLVELFVFLQANCEEPVELNPL